MGSINHSQDNMLIQHHQHDSSASVMEGLFNKGYFDHIILDIFFNLSPPDLLSCSLVSRQWYQYILKHLWTRHEDEMGCAEVRRIIHNWLKCSPVMYQIKLNTRYENVPQNKSWINIIDATVQSNHSSTIIPFANRFDFPRYIVADREEIICATFNSIDVFSRLTLKLEQRLFSTQIDMQWQLSLSKRFLIGKQRSVVYSSTSDTVQRDSKRKIHVWDRENGYCKLGMKQEWDEIQHHPIFEPHHQIHLVEEDIIICESVTRSHIFAIRIKPETLSFEFLWRYNMSYEQMTINQRKIFMCGQYTSNYTPNCLIPALTSTSSTNPFPHTFKVELISAKEGKSMLKMPFKFDSHSSNEDVVKGVGFTQPVGIVLLGQTQEIDPGTGWLTYSIRYTTIYMLDVANSFVLRRLNFDSYPTFGDLSNVSVRIWCDPPFGMLLMAVKSKTMAVINTGECRNIAIWNIENILRNTEENDMITPDRVLMTKGVAHADIIVPSMYSLIHMCFDKNGNGLIVDCDFWGKLN